VTAEDYSNVVVDVVDDSVRIGHQQLGVKQLFGSQNDSILAFYSYDSTNKKYGYSAFSRTFCAYSSWKILPSCEKVAVERSNCFSD
jgi:hypothetical protein